MLKNIPSWQVLYGIEADRLVYKYNRYLETRDSYKPLMSLEEYFDFNKKNATVKRSEHHWEEIWKVFLLLYKIHIKQMEKNKK